MGKFCTKCGAKFTKGTGFCVKCGHKIEVEQPTPPQPVQQQVPPSTSSAPALTTPPPQQPAPQQVAAPVAGGGKSKSNALKFAAVIAVAVVLVIAAFYFGFMMGGDGEKSSGAKGTENYGVVMGRVTDTGGFKLGDVKVTANGQPVETNDQGWFSISNVTEGDRVIVDFERDGYATTHRVVDVETGESSFIDATMSPVDKTDSFSGNIGGAVTTTSGGSIDIGAKDLEDISGNTHTDDVYISMTVFDPSDDEDANAFPGEYLGISGGEYYPIKSFGFMDISVTDSYGNELQLKDGQTATITIPVPSSLQSDASSLGTCPLWYFDTDTGYWMEDGQGTYDSSSKSFVGTITHFSTWNYDVAYPRAYISGRVVDSSGNPVSGAEVTCWGPGWKYFRWASGETSTASDGTFNRIPVECTVIFKYKASKGGYDSSEYTIPRALECDEEYDVGDIVLGSVSTAQITLTWGENPDDLDSHLVIPSSGSQGPYHLYYYFTMDDGYDFSTTYPYANLDTDDTSSYGPEVITILKLYPGTYRYCVRHYSGLSDIENSDAEINVIIPGVGIYKFTPPSGQTSGTDIWRVFDIVVGSSGTITSVNTINDYVTGGDESELLFP